MSSESCIYLGFAVSKFSLAIIIIVSVLALLLLLLGHQFYSERDPSATNFVVYLLFALFGALTALATSNLIMIFIGLVIVSIAVTNLVKLYGNRSGLAGLQKFWIYLLVTDLLFCLGAAFFFGATGTLEIGASSDLLGIINKAYTGNYFKIAIAILGVSLMAKMAIIPFHWWLLDFAGSNSLALTNVITVFYRTVMMLIFMKIFAPLVSLWGHFFEVPLVAIAIITMTWANLAAVRSSDLRQLFIYSSIAHVGYFLVLFPTLLVESSVGLIAMVVFIVAFSIIHLGSFAVLHLFSSEGSVQTNFADLNGLGRRQPWLCLVVCLFLFALAGSPPMVTFLVRLMILKEVVLSGNYYILGALIINMAIAIFYYLRPIANMFIVKSTKEAGTPVELSYSLVIVIAFSALVALYLGIQPTSFLHWIQLSIAGI
jgi:NADH-quinone oxidoreductase subunit N